MNLPEKEMALGIKKALGLVPLIELIQLTNNHRAGCRFAFPLSKEPIIARIAGQLHLQYVMSSLPVQQAVHSLHAGSFCSDDPGEDDPLFYYYFAGNSTVALLLSMTEGKDVVKQGAFFGYPACCTHFFKENFKKGSEDLTYHVAAPRGPHSFWNNRTTKLFGYSLISHFPCSWDCKASEQVAKKTYQCLKQVLPQEAERCISVQRQNLLYSTDKIVLIGSEALRQQNGRYVFDKYIAQPADHPDFIYLPFYSACL